MLVDRETGYINTVECECRKCPICDGEGVIEIHWTQDNRGNNVACWKELPCERCKGSGRDSDDCGIHGKDATCCDLFEKTNLWHLETCGNYDEGAVRNRTNND